MAVAAGTNARMTVVAGGCHRGWNILLLNMSVTMPGNTLFPSIIPGSDDEFIDARYTQRELEGMEYETLRAHAAAHESDAVNGRMGKGELREGLVGLERVNIDE